MLFSFSAISSDTVRQIEFSPPPHMTKAKVWTYNPVKKLSAVLVICPGMNGSAESFVRNREWQEFCFENGLGLMGLSFASLPSDLYAGRGYTFPDQGSGDLLLKALQESFHEDLPIILYGFSSGAYFTELFVSWKPERVLTWCAHATGHYARLSSAPPPGIISCGELDPGRYGGALAFFKENRVAGGNVLWIGVPGLAHKTSLDLDLFVKAYFSTVVQRKGVPTWVDIDYKIEISHKKAKENPSLSGWIPCKSLLKSWQDLGK